MQKVVACYKWVRDETEIKLRDDLSVNFNDAQGKISDYDKNTIEAAVQMAAVMDAEPIALTFGSKDVGLSIKPALSRGPVAAYYVNSDAANTTDHRITANVLAAAIRSVSDVQLVLCTEGASDTFARQTGPRMGAALDWPVVTSVIKLELKDGLLYAVRRLENKLQTVKTTLPAIISILPELCEAPIPGIKAVMAAGKKPVTMLKVEDLNLSLQEKLSAGNLKGYVMNRKNIAFKEGSPAEKAAQLVEALKKEGIA